MSVLHSIADVASVIPRTHRTIVGIAGSPGAGKSTIGAALVAELGSDAVLLAMDGFHLPQARLVELGRRERMGAPDTFDVDAFVSTLTALADPGNSGNPVFAPGFNREIEEPVPDDIRISPEIPVIVIEGNYLLLDSGGWERVAPMLDVTLFVGVDPDLRRQRLIDRHVRFGKSLDAATAWALGPDEANARLIDATAARAQYRVELP